MVEQLKSSSPLARRLGTQMMRLFKGSPEVIASDFTSQEVDWNATTAGDSSSERRFRRANQTLRDLNQDAYDRSRSSRYSDFREMRDEVPEMATALQVLTDFVFGGDSEQGTEIVFHEDATEDYRNVVNGAFTAVGSSQFFIDVFREATCLGDSFSELIYSKSGLIAERALPADVTDVMTNNYSQVNGYKVSTGSSFQNKKAAVILNPIQVLHYAPDKMRGSRYGRSMWATARKLWRQSESAEDVMSLLSLLQAAARKSVAYPVPSNLRPDQVDDLMESLKSGAWTEQVFDRDGKMKRRITSMLAMDDVVYPYREGSEKPTFHNEQPANLTQLVDVLRFLQDRFFIVTGVPAALCGFEKNVSARATLEQQGLQFVRTVRRKQSEVKYLIDMVMLRGIAAAGLTPEIKYTVKMPPVSSFDEKLKAEVLKMKADTAKVLAVDLGLDMRFILQDVLGLSDERANELMTEAHLKSGQSATVNDVAAMINHLEGVADEALKNGNTDKVSSLFKDSV